jgi:signal transduction histidine kinase
MQPPRWARETGILILLLGWLVLIGGAPAGGSARVRPIRIAPDPVGLFAIAFLPLGARRSAQRRKRRPSDGPLTDRTELQRLIADLCGMFAGLPIDRHSAEIQRSLPQVASCTGVDRVDLLECTEDSYGPSAALTWMSEGIEATPFLFDTSPSIRQRERLLQGRVLHAACVRDLPVVLGEEREVCRGSGIQAIALIPLVAGRTLLGVLVLSNLRAGRAWSDDLVHDLRLLGQIYANALALSHFEAAAQPKQMEALAQQRYREVERVAQVLALGELAAALAHELRQPLAAILSNAQAAQRFLSEQNPDLEEVRQILVDIGDDDKRAVEILRRIHGLINREQPGFLPVNLDELVRYMAHQMSGEARSSQVPIELELDPAQSQVHGDPIQLQQALSNLMRNALQAMQTTAPALRRLTIRTCVTDAQTMEVALQDAGEGIPVERLTEIFKPFYSTKPEGMGIGLAITRSIAELHGGRLWATNNPDRGATFHLTLPLQREGSPQSLDEPHAAG